MIDIKRAIDEPESSDIKRRRLLLIVGTRQWHITREEARKLRSKLNRFKLD